MPAYTGRMLTICFIVRQTVRRPACLETLALAHGLPGLWGGYRASKTDEVCFRLDRPWNITPQ